MSREVEPQKQEAFTIGRGDIKLPTIDSIKSPLNYFRDFWEINGYKLPENNRKPFKHEIAVPAGDNEPTIIIRGKYKDLSDKNKVYRKDDLNNLYLLGQEKHVVFLAPQDKAGELTPFLSASFDHVTGSGNFRFWPTEELTFKDSKVTLFDNKFTGSSVGFNQEPIKEFIALLTKQN